MAGVKITCERFLKHRQGRTFSDVATDPNIPFALVLGFFSDESRQRRMEESELHHDRPALAGVVRELESLPAVDRFMSQGPVARSKRLRQATGVVVSMIMESRGWRKTGRKGSLGIRASTALGTARHNSGGLAFWFIRGERYQLLEGMPFRTVRDRCRELAAGGSPRERHAEPAREMPPGGAKPRRQRSSSGR